MSAHSPDEFDAVSASTDSTFDASLTRPSQSPPATPSTTARSTAATSTATTSTVTMSGRTSGNTRVAATPSRRVSTVDINAALDESFANMTITSKPVTSRPAAPAPASPRPIITTSITATSTIPAAVSSTVIGGSRPVSTTTTTYSITTANIAPVTMADIPIVEGVSDGDILLQGLLDSIANDNIEEFDELLIRVPVKQLSNDIATRFFITLLTQAATHNRLGLKWPTDDATSSSFVRNILEYWENSSTLHVTNVGPRYIPDGSVSYDTEKISFLTSLFVDYRVPAPLLAFIVKDFPDRTFADVVEELIQWDDSDVTAVACNKALIAYGPQDRSTYETLHQLADPDQPTPGNPSVYNFLTTQLDETEPFADVPEWVQNYLTLTLPDGREIAAALPQEDEIEAPQYEPYMDLPPVEEIADLLVEGLKNSGVQTSDSIENVRQVLEAQLRLATPAVKQELLAPILDVKLYENLWDNVELFRILGPDNPAFNATADELRANAYRMFLNDTFDYDELTDEAGPWFHGQCELCRLRIRHYWHALRMPQPMGGWEGCYCSFDCLRAAVAKREADTNTPLMLIRLMVDVVEDQITELGIQDRRSNDDDALLAQPRFEDDLDDE